MGDITYKEIQNSLEAFEKYGISTEEIKKAWLDQWKNGYDEGYKEGYDKGYMNALDDIKNKINKLF